MASIKDLKKDIDLLFSIVLNDCFYIAGSIETGKKDAVMAVAASLIEKHSEFREKVNHPDGKDNRKLIKKYYQGVISDMNNYIEDTLAKLTEIAEVK